MSLDYTLVFTSPDGSTTATGFPTSVLVEAHMNEASNLMAIFENGWDDFEDEDAATNAVQMNSYIVFTRGTQVVFRGWVFSRRLIERGEQTIEIIALDLIAKLNTTVASISGEPLFTKQTPAVDISATVLEQAAAIGDTLYPFYPDPSDTDPWIPSASSNTTSLDANIDDAVTTIVASTSQSGILPMGFIRIETEWIQYDGYDYSVADSKYRFKNCTRGALGTTAAAHATPQTIYERRSQKIHPREPVLIEGNDDGTWKPITTGSYVPQPEEGRFDFTYDILDYPSGDSVYSALRATYAVFAEADVTGTCTGTTSTTVLKDSSATFISDGVQVADTVTLDAGGETANVVSIQSETQLTTGALSASGTYDTGEAYTITRNSIVTLDEIIDGVLTETVANGGPGLVSADLALTGLSAINLTRVRLAEPETTLNFIRNLMDELGLSKDVAEDAIGMWYNAGTDKLHIQALTQQTGTVDQTYANMPVIDRDLSLEQIHSAVLIRFTSGQNENLASHARMWHPTVWANEENDRNKVGSNSEKVTGIDYMDAASDGYSEDTGTSSHNIYTDRMTDVHAETGWGLHFQANPGDEGDGLYGWFDGSLNSYVIEEVEITIDCRQWSQAVDPFWFQLRGVTDTGTDWKADPTDAVNGVPEVNKIGLHGALDKRFLDGKLKAYDKLKLEARDIGITCEGFVCRWNGMQTATTNAANRVARIKEIIVRGHTTKTAFVQITNDATKDATYVYAPTTYTKLIDSSMGQPRVRIIDVGQATYDSAVSLGRLALLQELSYKATRFYEIQSNLYDGAIPVMGETALFQDGHRGVVLYYRFEMTGGVESLQVRSLDFTATLI